MGIGPPPKVYTSTRMIIPGNAGGVESYIISESAMRYETAVEEGRIMELLHWLNLGTPVQYACAISRIPRSTLYYWRKLSQEGKPGYEALDNLMTQAEAGLIRTGMSKLDQIINCDDPKAATKALTWFLEKRFPKEFGSAASLKVEGGIGDQKISISAMVEAISNAGQNGGNGQPDEEEDD